MVPYKYYIRYNWGSVLFGFTINRFEVEVYILFFIFGIDFTKDAKGFGTFFWW